ncbi:high-affinity choline transporter 1-like [Brachionichthys hirsutus]|uniref:high-affinity choline transporter 1-like n=1 Tax=Brachionichthys hirsutus TaxID=412623 RepID=UPI003604D379
MAVNIVGLIMVVIFYIFVLGIGIWTSVKSKKMERNAQSRQVEISFLANRSIGLMVGIFTMTATWVGGAFVIGIAESVSDPTKGLIWALIPLQVSFSFIIGGLFFAKPMREKNYISVMDPFERKYGKELTAVLAIVSVLSEVIWIPGLMTALGATMTVVLGLPFSVCVWISAAVAIIYTVLGGLYSVAYTDVIQMSLILISLSVGNLAIQDFHQRTLSSTSTSTARLICFIAAGGVIISAIPSMLIGAVAASTDWNSTSYGSPSPHERGESAMALPITLSQSTPTFIFALAIGGVAAAAMSSADSLLLSATTIFTTNIYQTIRSQASDKELKWVIRCSIILSGLVGTSLTYLRSGILVFWILGSDLNYTIIFPQLVCALFTDVSNGYGATAGFLVAVVLRLLCGEPLIGLPVILHFPHCILEDGVYVQTWPFKTICMLITLVSILAFSYVFSVLFQKGILPERWDVFKVKTQQAPPAEVKGDETVSEPMLQEIS